MAGKVKSGLTTRPSSKPGKRKLKLNPFTNLLDGGSTKDGSTRLEFARPGGGKSFGLRLRIPLN